MPGTYSQILLHFAFSTRHRANLITPDLRSRLYSYIGGIIRSEKGTLYEIGGMPDHVHLLVRWRTDRDVATLMRNVKSHSTAWVKENYPSAAGFQWQEGYGVFSVSQSQCEAVKAYIARQAEHHGGRTFADEFVAMLNAHQIEYDEKYLWD